MKSLIISLLMGMIFGAGLVLGGMTQPENIIRFRPWQETGTRHWLLSWVEPF